MKAPLENSQPSLGDLIRMAAQWWLFVSSWSFQGFYLNQYILSLTVVWEHTSWTLKPSADFTCVCEIKWTDRCLPLCHHQRSCHPFSCWLITKQECHCIFIADFIGLQTLQNSFTCYFSKFLQQPCEVVDKYFSSLFWKGGNCTLRRWVLCPMP